MQQEDSIILDSKQMLLVYSKMQKQCVKMQNCEQSLQGQKVVQKLLKVLQIIKQTSIFSPNETINEIQTQNLKYLMLPYWLGFIYGRLNKFRKQSILQSKNYLTSYLKLCENFNCEDQEIFPSKILKSWRNFRQNIQYKMSRQQLIQNMKQKKIIQNRYQNSQKIKQESESRQSIKNYIILHIYDSITQLKSIQQQLDILKYKDTLLHNQQAKQKYQEEILKPLPKMKVWEIKKPEEIQNSMIPSNDYNFNMKKNLVAQVWEENANKPTMTLEEVGRLQQENMKVRMKRQQQQKLANIQDTDSDKEQVDDRQKKKARNWDNWKDENEKGAGNRNGK